MQLSTNVYVSLAMIAMASVIAPSLSTAAASRDTSVKCFKDKMQLTIKRGLFRKINFQLLKLHDPKCKPKINDTHVIITAPLIGCGTNVKHTNKAVVYSNAVTNVASKGMVTRKNSVYMPFSCYYSKEGISSTLGILPRLVSKKLSGSNWSINFVLSMKLYKDKSYRRQFLAKDFPMTVGLNQPLFIEVGVESPNDQLSVLIDKCYATPSQNPLDRVTYSVIQQGCPSDPTLHFYYARHSRKRFSFNSFQFVGVSQKFVFIHCKLLVCNATDFSSPCARGCQPSLQSRLKRGLTIEDYDFTQGPILVEEDSHGKKSEMQGLETTSSAYVWLIIGLLTICLLSLASTIFMQRKISKAREYQSKSEESGETHLQNYETQQTI